ncbi:MAG: glutaredoxin 3 [Alphaproteobacteria bacterium]|nr:glutaredoxin 3 [Alphaproteobacteria bacterium]
MAKVEVYTTDYCPYCTKAKTLLQMKGVSYEEIDVTGDDDARIALVEKAEGRRTVPQIFINDQPIGGFDDMNALNEKGELDKLLSS